MKQLPKLFLPLCIIIVSILCAFILFRQTKFFQTQPTVTQSSPVVTPATPPETPDLANSTVRINNTPLNLKAGTFTDEKNKQSATLLSQWTRSIDMNKDGKLDSVGILAYTSGAGGERIYLVCLLGGGEIASIPPQLLGDRVKVTSVQEGEIAGAVEVRFLTRKPNEALVNAPTVSVKQRFNLKNNAFSQE